MSAEAPFGPYNGPLQYAPPMGPNDPFTENNIFQIIMETRESASVKIWPDITRSHSIMPALPCVICSDRGEPLDFYGGGVHFGVYNKILFWLCG
jgi:hypothetical protein